MPGPALPCRDPAIAESWRTNRDDNVFIRFSRHQWQNRIHSSNAETIVDTASFCDEVARIHGTFQRPLFRSFFFLPQLLWIRWQ